MCPIGIQVLLGIVMTIHVCPFSGLAARGNAAGSVPVWSTWILANTASREPRCHHGAYR